MGKLRHVNREHCPGDCPACRASAKMWGVLIPAGDLDPATLAVAKNAAIAEAENCYEQTWAVLEVLGFRVIRVLVQPSEAVRP